LRSNSGNAPACCVCSATTSDPAAALRLAERVAEAASSLGLESALTGAAALAVHRYTRGTEDIDLAVAVDPQRQLLALERELSARGLATRIRMPDDEAPSAAYSLSGVSVRTLPIAIPPISSRS
jgi:hypothetical protein